MGGGIAECLLRSGVRLAVHDRRPEATERFVDAGAIVCQTPRMVGDLAATVLVSLPSPNIVRTVACGEGGLIEGRRLRTYVDLSTTGSVVAADVASVLAARNVVSLDAPVSGGPARAAKGELTVMAAGSREALDRVRPLLDKFARKVFFVGERIGQAQVVKLANNVLSAGAIILTGEALALVAKHQVDPAVALDVFNMSSGQNTATAEKFPRHVIPRSFDYGFRLKLMAKDVHLFMEEAAESGLPMVLGGVMDQVWRIAETRANDDDDVTRVVTLLEQWAEVEISFEWRPELQEQVAEVVKGKSDKDAKTP
jgi:3-hydroxyisobutyrate dehydrogenase-like beta-hydroxyacid dehydrogenase